MRFPIPADVRLLPAGPVQGDDQRPAVNGGAGTSAGHEDLRVDVGPRRATPHSGGFPRSSSPPVTDVPPGYT
ncbi:MAG TPA: hypothetical protein VHH34_07465 [Pseudonocardiaceae bacterium]|nr:hypothetical protein [Pseudonocardiaceae bacterium]